MQNSRFAYWRPLFGAYGQRTMCIIRSLESVYWTSY